MPKIGIISGSTRTGSWTQKIARDMIATLPEDIETVVLPAHELPFYNQDWDTPDHLPAAVAQIRELASTCDGFLIVSPEYNRSAPGVVKNALDVLSRPFATQAFAQKPTLVATVTPGAMGGFGAHRDIRTVLAFLDARIINQPEVYLSNVAEMYDGETLNTHTAEFLAGAMAKLIAEIS